MALIKNVKSDRLLKEAIVLDMGDLGHQATRILDAARAEASLILESARAEAQLMIESADGRGFADGRQRGLSEGLQIGQNEGREQAHQERAAELAQLASKWSAALQRWEADRANMYQDAREDVIRFAFALARKVTHRTVASDPTIVRDQVESALAVLSRSTSVEIAVHPDDRPLIEQTLPEIIAAASASHHATIREDAAVERGGCIINTPGGGRIDATIDTQLDRIAEALVPPRQSTDS